MEMSRSDHLLLSVWRKKKILNEKQKKHVMNEKHIMEESDCTFIVKLFKTFQDGHHLYMLTESFLGGELWTVLRNRRGFTEKTTRFYLACVTEALEYLHNRGIVYRDLKAENLLLNKAGYVKLVDLGFAKKLNVGEKTWTFCGTPEYVAPEIIMSKGHDEGADYWALGILMFEFLKGRPPFTSTNDQMSTYKKILNGMGGIKFPPISNDGEDLIKRLCRREPLDRIGYHQGGMEKIRQHKWFGSFDWEGLRLGSLIAPIKPNVKSCTDASNFDKFPKEKETVLTDEFIYFDESF